MSGYTATEHHPAFEEYCETIFELEEDGLTVIQARIAERMEISRPAVSEMIRRLTTEGFVTSNNGEIKLTEDGRQLANRMVRRHRLAERFLTDILKLSWSEAHHEAGKWEHVISDSVEASLTELLGEPTTCPHGNPIPGSGYVEPITQPLDSIEVNGQVTISRIPEELEFVPGLLEYLESNNMVPGIAVKVLSTSPDGTTTLDVDGKVVGVSAHTAARILVLAP